MSDKLTNAANTGASASARQGTETPATALNSFNTMTAMADKASARVSVAIPVKVVKVTGGAGALAPGGTVDVQPLVQQIDGYGNGTPHETVYGIPYHRYQGGDTAVIFDPRVGDVGYMIVADRDTSVVKKTLKSSLPGSRRRFSYSDGTYFGVYGSSEAPRQYIRSTDDGLEISDRYGNKIVMSASGIQLISSSGTIKATAGGKTVDVTKHLHSGVQPGGGNSGQPVNGS